MYHQTFIFGRRTKLNLDFGSSDTWIWIYAAIFGLGKFILPKILNRFNITLLDRLKRTRADGRLEKENADFKRKIADLEKELAIYKEKGGGQP